MRPRTFLRFLRTLPAIQAHLLFGVLIVALTVGLLNGDAADDAKLGLVFCAIGYPIVIALLWWQYHDEI